MVWTTDITLPRLEIYEAEDGAARVTQRPGQDPAWAGLSRNVSHAAGGPPSLTRALPPGTEMGLFTRVMVLVTPPTTVVTTWACWATVTVPDLCTVMMGRVDVLAAEETDVPTWAAAVFSMRVAGLLTWRERSRAAGGAE